MAGRGSIYQRAKNTWRVELFLGVDPLTKEKKRITRTVHGTKKDAERVLRDLAKQLDDGELREPTKMTVAEYLESWLETHKNKIAETSYDWYKMVCERHIIPVLGHIRLQQLTPLMVQEFYNKKLGSPALNGRGVLSASSIDHIHKVLHRALNQAVKLHLIANNPCDAVEPPKPKKADIDFWTPDEVIRFLDAIRGDRLYALFYLALHTGMRRGEILGLMWEDMDLENGFISVRRAIVRRYRGTVVKEPKTEKSRRRIQITRDVVDVLKAYKVIQNKERLLFGEDYVNTGYVFTKPEGGPLEPCYVTGYFNRLVKKAGVRSIKFHALRHTHATLLGAAGVPLKSVSARLGHSSVVMTGDIYSHVFSDMDREAADTFEEILNKAKAGKKDYLSMAE